MRCPQVQNAFLAFDDSLGVEEKKHFERHVEQCAFCATVLEELAEVDANLKRSLAFESQALARPNIRRVSRSLLWKPVDLGRSAVAAASVLVAVAVFWLANGDVTRSSREAGLDLSKPQTDSSPNRKSPSLKDRIAIEWIDRRPVPEELRAVRDRVAMALFDCADEIDEELLPAFEEKVADLRRDGWPVENTVCRLTEDDEIRVASTAVRVLGRTARVGDALTVSRRLTDPRLVDVAVKALGRFRGEVAVAKLTSWMAKSSDPAKVVNSLASIGTPSARRSIVRFAKACLSEPSRDLEGSMEILESAMSALVAFGPSALDAADELSRMGCPDEPVRRLVASLGDSATDVIYRGLDGASGDLDLSAAIRLAGLMQWGDLLPRLSRSLTNPGVCRDVLEAMRRIGGVNAAVTLVEAIRAVEVGLRDSLDAALLSIVLELPRTEGIFRDLTGRLTLVEVRELLDLLKRSTPVEGSFDCLLTLARWTDREEFRVLTLFALAELDRPEFAAPCEEFLRLSPNPKVRAAALLSACRLSPNRQSVDLDSIVGRSSRLRNRLWRSVKRWREDGVAPDALTLKRVAAAFLNNRG